MENIETLLSEERRRIRFGIYAPHYDYEQLGRNFSSDIVSQPCTIHCRTTPFSLQKKIEEKEIDQLL